MGPRSVGMLAIITFGVYKPLPSRTTHLTPTSFHEYFARGKIFPFSCFPIFIFELRSLETYSGPTFKLQRLGEFALVSRMFPEYVSSPFSKSGVTYTGFSYPAFHHISQF